MAKATTPTQTTQQPVATATGAALPAWADEAAADAGKGVSTAQEDNTVPLIIILQEKSKYAKRTGADYVQGAEPGNILLRGANIVISGTEGMQFQPCYFYKEFVEWAPRDTGSGVVARHATMDERLPPEGTDQQATYWLPDGREVKKTADANRPNRWRWMLSNGNEIVETRYHVGIVHYNNERLAYVMPMASTQHTASREWMTTMNRQFIKPGVKAPSFACLYKLKLKERHNSAGDWYVWTHEHVGWVPTKEDYERGRELYDAFVAGTKQAQVDDEVVSEGDSAGATDNNVPF